MKKGTVEVHPMNRMTAMILLMIYVTMMHPLLGYSEEGSAWGEEARKQMGLSMEVERSAVTIEAESGGEVRLYGAAVRIPAGAAT